MCKANDVTNTNQPAGVKCMCDWGISRTAGHCAWPGPNAYENFFPALKRAIKASSECHHDAYKFFLHHSPFNGVLAGSGEFTSFTSWYRCINDTSLLTELLNQAKPMFYWASKGEDTYVECLSHYSLDILSCQHWTEDDRYCMANTFGLATLTLLILGLF